MPCIRLPHKVTPLDFNPKRGGWHVCLLLSGNLDKCITNLIIKTMAETKTVQQPADKVAKKSIFTPETLNRVKYFSGIFLSSLNGIKTDVGKYDGTIVSEAKFRSFNSKSDNKLFGVLEVNVEISSSEVIAVRLDTTDTDFFLGDKVKVSIDLDSKEKKYKNAVMIS
jgi:hypothetical protein